MSNELLLESLDRHFLAGCPGLSTAQLDEHRARGVCGECETRAQGDRLSLVKAHICTVCRKSWDNPTNDCACTRGRRITAGGAR